VAFRLVHLKSALNMSAVPPIAPELVCRNEPTRCAKSSCEQPQQTTSSYSITASASASIVDGIVRPIALAVLRLMTNSNLVAC